MSHRRRHGRRSKLFRAQAPAAGKESEGSQDSQEQSSQSEQSNQDED